MLENKYQPGYITEKIVLAFWAGCIPIYYGSQEVFDMFNRRAFVYYDPDRPQPALDQIVRLETNTTAHDEMMKEPILAQGTATVDRYFSLQDGRGRGSWLKHKIRDIFVRKYTIWSNPKLENKTDGTEEKHPVGTGCCS